MDRRWRAMLRKVIRVAKLARITSLADFVASRYGKSALLGGLVTVIAVIGIRKDELGPTDLLIVPLAAEASTPGAEGSRPSSDIAIHRAIYQARADVMAVVHAHLPAAMALTLAGEVPDPSALPETALLLPRLPYIPFAAPGSAQLAAWVADALVEGPEPLPGAVLLERHGAVAVGMSVDQALDRLELVEVLCRTWRDALLLRGAVGGTGGRAILSPPTNSRRDP